MAAGVGPSFSQWRGLSEPGQDGLDEMVEVRAQALQPGGCAVDPFDGLSRHAVDVAARGGGEQSAVVPLDSFDQAFAALRQPDKTIKALIRTGDGPG